MNNHKTRVRQNHDLIKVSSRYQLYNASASWYIPVRKLRDSVPDLCRAHEVWFNCVSTRNIRNGVGKIKTNTKMTINRAVGNLNGVKQNERVVKCSWVKFKWEEVKCRQVECSLVKCSWVKFKWEEVKCRQV